MLIELHIENLGIIERASVSLRPGMTALTGETGAGKTMLIEAIDLLVGGRADSTVVRHSAAEARVDGRIVIGKGDRAVEHVISRVVPADGRSRAYVDGRPVTVGHLAELGAELIDLHGQHAHQSLLSSTTQRAALDRWAGTDLEPLEKARAVVDDLDGQLADLGGDERSRAREIDLLRYQVDELDQAAVADPLEEELLADEESILADAVAHQDAGAAAMEALGENGAADRIGDAVRSLAERSPFSDLSERLAGVAAEIDDISTELRRRVEEIEHDPDRLETIRQRRQLLNDVKRKYGRDLAEVIEFHRQASSRLHELERFDERAANIDAARVDAMQQVRAAANRVGEQRRLASRSLAEAVEERLRGLGLPDARLEIEFADDPEDAAADRLRFLFSANPGTDPMPLNRVASGGELARAMLALRLALTTGSDPEQSRTLVFDEVDAGIGGSAAIAVGRALASLAETHQVLVVTHLAQVAAQADTQIVVSKSSADSTVITDVEAVEGERRVRELARMLSGENSEAAVEHARSLLGAPEPNRREKSEVDPARSAPERSDAG